MAKDRKEKANGFAADDKGGWLTNFLADEDSFDRRALWRLGSWGMAAVAAVTIAVLANKSYVHTQRDQIAAADLDQQSKQIQHYAREAEVENKRLSSAIQTLNSDRDRLYARVTTLEQGLDSVTGSLPDRHRGLRRPLQTHRRVRQPTGPCRHRPQALKRPPQTPQPRASFRRYRRNPKRPPRQ